MFKSLLLICLIIKTHSWTWEDYPSPRGTTYWKCGVLKPTWVCDPDGMLTDQQRKEIVELVEDFKEKTKRPKSNFECAREGLVLVVALAKDKIGPENITSGVTKLCTNNRRWTSFDIAECGSNVHGIELNANIFRHCYQVRWLRSLHGEEYQKLYNTATFKLENGTTYFDVLKNYIINLRTLYLNRFTIFDNQDSSNEDTITLLQLHLSLQDTNRKLSELQQIQSKMFIGKNITTNSSKFIVIFSNNLLGIISIIISLIIGLVLLFLICQIRQIKKYHNQRNTSKTETQLMTPIQPVEIVEKRREKEGSEEATKPLLTI